MLERQIHRHQRAGNVHGVNKSSLGMIEHLAHITEKIAFPSLPRK